MIDYQKIADAVKYYSDLEYKYIDVPWLISLDSVLITRPVGARIFETFAGTLVASGEQSFLEIRKNLKPGKYQCVTPCFRDEPIYDKLHHQYFIKNELIIVCTYFSLKKELQNIINDAKNFFFKYTKGPLHITDDNIKQKTDLFYPFDIKIDNIEVGSYGCRNYQDFYWVYGTGCAEPRLTQALQG